MAQGSIPAHFCVKWYRCLRSRPSQGASEDHAALARVKRGDSFRAAFRSGVSLRWVPERCEREPLQHRVAELRPVVGPQTSERACSETSRLSTSMTRLERPGRVRRPRVLCDRLLLVGGERQVPRQQSTGSGATTLEWKARGGPRSRAAEQRIVTSCGASSHARHPCNEIG